MTFLIAAIFAPILWIFGFRRRVFNRNLELMNGKHGSSLRFNLGFNAIRDLTALFLGSKPKANPDSRAQIQLKKMRNGPSILLTAHFHNWEQLGSLLRREGVPLLAAARPLRNLWAERLLSWLRKRIGVPVVSQSVPRTAVKHLRTGGCFALLWDQHSPDSEYVGTFFDLPVRMNPLPIFVLNHRPCPVYFGLLLPGGDLRLIPLLSRFQGNWEEDSSAAITMCWKSWCADTLNSGTDSIMPVSKTLHLIQDTAMHPFLPVLSLILLAMGDAMAYFLRWHGHDPDIIMHRPSLWALIGVSLFFGIWLAFWLRRFRIHFPSWFAVISLLWVILLALL